MISGLKNSKIDKFAQAIVRRIDVMVIGAFSDCKTINTNLLELRLFFGPGYRVYYTIKKE